MISLTSRKNSSKLPLARKSRNAYTVWLRDIFAVRKLLMQHTLSSSQKLFLAQHQARLKFSWFNLATETSVRVSDRSDMRNLSANSTASKRNSMFLCSNAASLAARISVFRPSRDVFLSRTRFLPDSLKLPSNMAEKTSERWHKVRLHASTVVPSSSSNVTVDDIAGFKSYDLSSFIVTGKVVDCSTVISD